MCYCSVDAKNAKTGKVFCVKTEVGCDPPKGSKDSGGEFPFLFVLFLYKTYSKRTDDVTTLYFHVTARSAKKGSTGKRLPVKVFAKKHFLTDFSSNQQVMAATQLSAIVTLMLRMLKLAKCCALRQKWGATRPRVLKTLVVSFLSYKYCLPFFLYKTYSKRTDNVTTHFHVTARSAQKRSAGKRLPVSEKNIARIANAVLVTI